jgi:hypothetical protein
MIILGVALTLVILFLVLMAIGRTRFKLRLRSQDKLAGEFKKSFWDTVGDELLISLSDMTGDNGPNGYEITIRVPTIHLSVAVKINLLEKFPVAVHREGGCLAYEKEQIAAAAKETAEFCLERLRTKTSKVPKPRFSQLVVALALETQGRGYVFDKPDNEHLEIRRRTDGCEEIPLAALTIPADPAADVEAFFVNGGSCTYCQNEKPGAIAESVVFHISPWA